MRHIGPEFVQIAENAWMVLREQGATLEEAIDDDISDDNEKGEGGRSFDETGPLLEKLALDEDGPSVTEIVFQRKDSLTSSIK